MRDPVVSMTKGIGIILMAVGHSGCPVFLHDFIYMFHMPLFFIMAGWCFKETYLKSIPKYVFKKLRGAICPLCGDITAFLAVAQYLCSITSRSWDDI